MKILGVMSTLCSSTPLLSPKDLLKLACTVKLIVIQVQDSKSKSKLSILACVLYLDW